MVQELDGTVNEWVAHCKPCWKQDLGVACPNIQCDEWRSHAGKKLAMQEFMNLVVGGSSFKYYNPDLYAPVPTKLDQYPSQKHTLDPVRCNEELEKLKRQEKEANDALRKEATHDFPDANTNSTNLLNVVSASVSAVGPSRALNDAEPSYLDDPLMPHLEDIFSSPNEGIYTNSSYDDEGVVTDFNNLEITMNVSPTPTTKIHTIPPKT
nr:hypothetical protein [Tanacetum cinerariifolium]